MRPRRSGMIVFCRIDKGRIHAAGRKSNDDGRPTVDEEIHDDIK